MLSTAHGIFFIWEVEMAVLFVNGMLVRTIAIFAYVLIFSLAFISYNFESRYLVVGNLSILSHIAIAALVWAAKYKQKLIFSRPALLSYFGVEKTGTRRAFIIQTILGFLFCTPASIFLNVQLLESAIMEIGAFRLAVLWLLSIVFSADLTFVASQYMERKNVG